MYINLNVSPGYQKLILTFDHSDLTAEQLRGLKLLFPLDVPTYQKAADWQYAKDLNGLLRFGTDTEPVFIECQINSAMVCEPIEGETQVLPPKPYEQAEGERLAALSPEERLAYVEKLIRDKTSPRELPKYRCVPVELARE